MSLKLKDALGRTVINNQIVFAVRGSYKSVYTGLAQVVNAETAAIRPVCKTKDGWHLDNKTNLQLGFSRSIIVDITEIEDDGLFNFLNAVERV